MMVSLRPSLLSLSPLHHLSYPALHHKHKMAFRLTLSLLAAIALTMVSLAPVAAHYVKLTNACHHFQVTGKITDTRWRGRTRPLVDGKFYTEGDTTAWLSTPMG